MSRATARDEFLAIMGAEGVPPRVAVLIMRHAATLQRIEIARCNRPLTEQDTKSERRAEARIRGLCSYYSVRPYFDGDPRGAVVKLRVPSGKNTSFGGEGLVCVPVSLREEA